MDIKKVILPWIAASTIIAGGVTHQVNQEQYEFTSKYEGVSLVPYRDMADKNLWTVCRGITNRLSPNFVIPGKKYTPEECFNEEVRLMAIVNAQIAPFIKVTMAYGQRNMLGDFVWNLGISVLRKSTMLKHINNNQCFKAADEFDKFVKAGGIVYKGLVTRRNDEEYEFRKYCLPNGKFPTRGLEYGN